jgi:hypothetical protein
MPGDLGDRGGELTFVDAAEAGKTAGAVDQQLIPDAARVALNDQVLREIEALPGEVIDDVFGVIGDTASLIMIEDGNDIAMDGVAVYRSRLIYAGFEFDHCRLSVLFEVFLVNLAI